MSLEKEIEISKELSTSVAYNHDTKSVTFVVDYQGKLGYSKLENGVKFIEILKKIAEGTQNKVDDVVVKALEVLMEKLG